MTRARLRSLDQPGKPRRGKPRKRFGQHFLEPAWVTKVVDAIAPAAPDVLLEIGPGRGALTERLAARVARLVAVEVDRDLAASLTARRIPNLTVVRADVLDLDLGALAQRELGSTPGNTVRVVGNLPYNISSPILFRLLDAAAAAGVFRDATLMLQKEVADRLSASPGSGDYGPLAITTALAADVTRVLELPPGAFRPMPKVLSAVVRLAFRPPAVATADQKVLIAMVRALFQQRRKMVANALMPFAAERQADAKAALAAAGIDPTRRPETLHLVELARLADIFVGR
jgi:16S rRNA (adenine1518-N6/adenine1519-N6)-dimethyltransferase